jgi:hypothetical protein
MLLHEEKFLKKYYVALIPDFFRRNKKNNFCKLKKNVFHTI